MGADEKRAMVGVFAGTAVFFAVCAFFGLMAAVADPNGGWAAWRVALLAGTIGAAVGLVVSVVGAIAWLEDQADRKKRERRGY